VETILAKALGQDVSKLAAQEKRLLLSRLLARLAHEIRNPLSSLDIHVQLLEEDLAQASAPLRDKTAGRLEIIHGELHRLENIVKHFLSLAGPSAVDLQNVNVGRIVDHVCGLLRPEAKTRQVELSNSIPGDLPAIAADAGQLTQALLNLVINSIQAIKANGRVQVSGGVEPGGATVWIRIQDDGPGIPSGKEQAIFEPFFTTRAEGSGLGLWIVQQIISAHGGTISAATAPEGGAVFLVELPSPKPQISSNG
jgi:two-component system sensor histidine kinase HydH